MADLPGAWNPKRLLEHHAFLGMVLLLAVLLNASFLGDGRYSDDFQLVQALRGDARTTGRSDSLWELYCFSDGRAETVRAKQEMGIAPWWTDPSFKMRFCRPLAALTHRLDLSLLGDRLPLLHAHSLLWFLLATLGAWSVYRGIAGPSWAASLAAVVFVLAPQTAILVGWISARNALMAIALGALSFRCHLEWCRRRSGAWLAASLALLVAGLFSSEASVGVGALVLAYALCLDEGDGRARASRVLPVALTGACWWLWYRAQGFGAGGSGLYLSPDLLEPAFLLEFARRYLSFLSVSLGVGLSVDLTGMGPPVVRLLLEAFAGLGSLVTLAVVVLAPRDRQLRFWTIAIALVVLPSCLGGPSDRILGLALVTAPGFVVRLLQVALGVAAGPRPLRARSLILCGLALILAARFLVVHPLLRPIYWGPFRELTRRYETSAVEGPLASPDVGGRSLFFVGSPGPHFQWNLPVIRSYHGLPQPARMRALFPGLWPCELRRIGPRRLEVRLEGRLFEHFYSRTYRSPRHPLRSGDRVDLGDVVYQVDHVEADGSPSRISLDFPGPLTPEDYLWLGWGDGAYRRLVPPAPGERVRFEPSIGWGFFLDAPGPLGSRLRRLAESWRDLEDALMGHD